MRLCPVTRAPVGMQQFKIAMARYADPWNFYRFVRWQLRQSLALICEVLDCLALPPTQTIPCIAWRN